MKTWVKTSATVGALCAAMALGACDTTDDKPAKVIEAVGPVSAKTSEVECKAALGMVVYDAGNGGNRGGSNRNNTPPKKPTKAATTAPTSAPTKPSDKPSGKTAKPKVCTTDYELVISTKEGDVEQDVTVEVWNACTEGEQYPECGREVQQ